MAARHLLLIDDNEDNRILVKFALERKTDWEVLTACSAVEGITKAKTERPDVILLDFIMPDLDGIAVLDVLKSNLFTCSIPVIFITAMVQTDLLSRLKNSLAVGVITKPFNIINFDSQISNICKWDMVSNYQILGQKSYLIAFLTVFGGYFYKICFLADLAIIFT